MAIPLNKRAKKCEEFALAEGRITGESSARPLLYDISRFWRKLLDATRFKSVTLEEWSEEEELAGELIISALTFLQRKGCKDIEQLLKDVMLRHEKICSK